MKKLIFMIASIVLIISGCAGHLSLKNSELKQRNIPKLSNVIVCTDLDSYLGPIIFPAFWSKFKFALQEERIAVKQLVFPPPGSIRYQPNLEYEAMQAGATHVIALYRGRGNVNVQGEYYVRTEIIANVIDVETGNKIWSANFDHRIGMMFFPEDMRANAIVDPIISEMRNVGLLESDSAAAKETKSKNLKDTNKSAESKRESVESRLKYLEDLHLRKVITDEEYKKKRQDIIDGL
jgi:hypothetical protein